MFVRSEIDRWDEKSFLWGSVFKFFFFSSSRSAASSFTVKGFDLALSHLPPLSQDRMMRGRRMKAESLNHRKTSSTSPTFTSLSSQPSSTTPSVTYPSSKHSSSSSTCSSSSSLSVDPLIAVSRRRLRSDSSTSRSKNRAKKKRHWILYRRMFFFVGLLLGISIMFFTEEKQGSPWGRELIDLTPLFSTRKVTSSFPSVLLPLYPYFDPKYPP